MISMLKAYGLIAKNEDRLYFNIKVKTINIHYRQYKRALINECNTTNSSQVLSTRCKFNIEIEFKQTFGIDKQFEFSTNCTRLVILFKSHIDQ